MKLHNNLIEESEISLIKNTFLYGGIGWFYNPLVDFTDGKNDYLDNHQFIHRFYDNDTITSDYIKLLHPIIDKLNPRSLIRIKANLTTRTENIIQHQYHTDYDYEGAKTSIFYLNSNNGYTIFRDETKIESVENRLITFDCKKEHAGTTCTDQKVRIVINFNYF